MAKSVNPFFAKHFLLLQQLESVTTDFHIVMSTEPQLREVEFGKKLFALGGGAKTKKDQLAQK